MLLNSLPYFLHVRLLETTLSTEDASIIGQMKTFVDIVDPRKIIEVY